MFPPLGMTKALPRKMLHALMRDTQARCQVELPEVRQGRNGSQAIISQVAGSCQIQACQMSKAPHFS